MGCCQTQINKLSDVEIHSQIYQVNCLPDYDNLLLSYFDLGLPQLSTTYVKH